MSEQMAMLGLKFMGNVVGGFQQREADKAQQRLTKAENLVAKANTYASNLVRDSNNELSAAVGSLNRFRQNLNNRQMLRTSGREQEQIQTNLQRALADLNSGKLEQRLDTSFELGSLAATTAAAGVGGGSKEVMNATIRMTEARKLSALSDAGDTMSYDALKMLTNTQADAYAQLDSTVILDRLDFSIDQYIPKFSKDPASPLQTVFNAAVNTASGNPQLTQQAAEGVRSTGSKSNSQATAYSGNNWASSVRV